MSIFLEIFSWLILWYPPNVVLCELYFFFFVDWFDEAPPTTSTTKANANHPADPYPRFAVSKI
jgi:hypothetical protein